MRDDEQLEVGCVCFFINAARCAADDDGRRDERRV